MAAVNWDQASLGSVSDPVEPALSLKNDVGRALFINAQGIGVEAESATAEAVSAHTDATLTARFESKNFAAVFAIAPRSFAVAGANFSHLLPAVIGGAVLDPALPPGSQPFGGTGVMGFTNRFAATGVVGIASNDRSTGVLGRAPLGTGVRGEGDLGPGVVGRSERQDGVQGFGFGYQAAGVRARSENGPGVDAWARAFPGVTAQSMQAEGVVGTAYAAEAAGLRGVNDGLDGIGVAAEVTNGTAVTATAGNGVCLSADSFNADGIHVETMTGVGLQVRTVTNLAIDAHSLNAVAVNASSLGPLAVDAFSMSTGVHAGSLGGPDASDMAKGCAVFGVSPLHAGVCGASLGGAGVLGIANPALGWAGCFHGNVFVGGMLLKFASLFSIDHPLDPEGKLLQHAAIEAPELKTFYDGIATLNRRGRARIRLPRWFGALNGTLRYQLTPLGGPAPELHVAAEVKDNVFEIAGGRPGLRVCWQVTGVRQDAWAKANPLEVETPKPAFRRAAEVPVTAIEKLVDGLRAKAEALKTRREPAARPAAKRRADPPPTPPTEVESSVPVDGAQAQALLARLGAGDKTG